MSNIFKKEFPKEDIINFIKEISSKETNNDYLFDINQFKKAKFNNKITQFIHTLEGFYKKKYEYYIKRENTFKNLMTIIRQLCKYHTITYTKKIKYIHNEYNIIYFFSL